MHNWKRKTQHFFPAHLTQVSMPNATVPLLASSNTHLLEWLHSTLHTRRTKKSQWNYSVMLGDKWWRRTALCCREELIDVGQMRLIWQAHLILTEHVGAEGSGLAIPLEAIWSFFWREHSSQTKYPPKNTKNPPDILDIGPNRNTSPSSTAGFNYLFCLLSSCPLVGEKSPGPLCFWLLVTIYCFSLWNTVSIQYCTSIQRWITEYSIYLQLIIS